MEGANFRKKPAKETSPDFCGFLHFNFSVDASGEGEILEGIYGFGGGVTDVNETLVDFHFEGFATGFVDVGAFNYGESTAFGRERDWAGDGGAGTDGGVDDLFGGLVDDAMVVAF